MIIEPNIKSNFQYKNDTKTFENANIVKEITALKEKAILEDENMDLKNKIAKLEAENKELKSEIKLLEKSKKKGGE